MWAAQLDKEEMTQVSLQNGQGLTVLDNEPVAAGRGAGGQDS